MDPVHGDQPAVLLDSDQEDVITIESRACVAAVPIFTIGKGLSGMMTMEWIAAIA